MEQSKRKHHIANNYIITSALDVDTDTINLMLQLDFQLLLVGWNPLEQDQLNKHILVIKQQKQRLVFGEAKNPVAEPLVVCLSDSVVCCII